MKQNKIYAIKFLEIDEEDEENLQKEIDILKESLSCLYIVQYYGCYLKDNTLMVCIVLMYMFWQQIILYMLYNTRYIYISIYIISPVDSYFSGLL